MATQKLRTTDLRWYSHSVSVSWSLRVSG